MSDINKCNKEKRAENDSRDLKNEHSALQQPKGKAFQAERTAVQRL